MVLAVLFLINRLTGQVHAQPFDGIGVHTGQDDGRVHVAAFQHGELTQGLGGSLVLGSRAGKGNQDLVGMQAGVLAAQIIGFQGLDGLNGAAGDEVFFLVDAGQLLEGIEQGRGSSRGPVLPVTTVPSGSWMAAAGAPPVFSETA